MNLSIFMRFGGKKYNKNKKKLNAYFVEYTIVVLLQTKVANK